jgi:hypothetical protein
MEARSPTLLLDYPAWAQPCLLTVVVRKTLHSLQLRWQIVPSGWEHRIRRLFERGGERVGANTLYYVVGTH